jgi:hypothetical protein
MERPMRKELEIISEKVVVWRGTRAEFCVNAHNEQRQQSENTAPLSRLVTTLFMPLWS